jgi:hypothetical protein
VGKIVVRKIDPEVAHHRGKYAALRRHRPDDTAALAVALGDLKAAQLSEHIDRLVNAAPALTNEQRERLAVLLRGAAA